MKHEITSRRVTTPTTSRSPSTTYIRWVILDAMLSMTLPREVSGAQVGGGFTRQLFPESGRVEPRVFMKSMTVSCTANKFPFGPFHYWYTTNFVILHALESF